MSDRLLKTLYLTYRGVYDDYNTGGDERLEFEKDFVRPMLNFESSITNEQIAEYMELYNPKMKYYINQEAETVKVIALEDFDKHLKILRKKREIKLLEKEIAEL